MLTETKIAANDNPPIDLEWRAELAERAPGIVARYLNSDRPGRRFAAEWWRQKYVEEFGHEPVAFA